MKRLLTFFACMLSVSLFAQNTINDNKDAWKTELPRHEIQLGFGDPIQPSLSLPTELLYNYDNVSMDNWFNSNHSFSTLHMITCSHSLAYKYRACKWLWVGGTVTYTGFLSKRIETGDKISMHYVTITPEVRFSYLNRKIVTLYSGFNLGVALKCINIPNDYSLVGFAGHINLFGVEVGTRWFGFFELGFGNKGIVTTGVGYHFNNKK